MARKSTSTKIAPDYIYAELRRLTKHDPFRGTHSAVALKLGISLPTVTKRLKFGDAETYTAFYEEMISIITHELKARIDGLKRSANLVQHVKEQREALASLDSLISQHEKNSPLPIPFDDNGGGIAAKVAGMQNEEVSSNGSRSTHRKQHDRSSSLGGELAACDEHTGAPLNQANAEIQSLGAVHVRFDRTPEAKRQGKQEYVNTA